MPDVVDNIEQVKTARLLGVVFSDNLNFDQHVLCFIYLFAEIVLNQLLRSQGMPERKLHEIFVALILSVG